MIKEDCIEIGYIAKPHGIEGYVVMRFNSDLAEEINQKGPLFLKIRGTLVPFFIEDFKSSIDYAYVKLEFINAREEAMKLIGIKVYADRNDFHFEEMIDPSVFVGYLLFVRKLNFEFSITEFIDHSDNPLFLVKSGKKKHFVPVNPEWIVEVDHEAKKIIMDLPEGLFD